MYKVLSPLIVLEPQDLKLTSTTTGFEINSLLTVLRVVYVTVRLGSGTGSNAWS